MLRELDSYKDKIVYFMTTDTKTPEYKLQTMNLDFNKRIFQLEEAFEEVKKEHDGGKKKNGKDIEQLKEAVLCLEEEAN